MAELSGLAIKTEIQNEHKTRVASLCEKGLKPKLAIVTTGNNPTIDLYIRLKQKYGAEIGVDVEVYTESLQTITTRLDLLSSDIFVTGIIVQLPLSDVSKTDEVLAHIPHDKDVDALRADSAFTPATPQAIIWLLEKNGVVLAGHKICIVGKGRLVGAPLAKLLDIKGITYTALEKGDDIKSVLLQATLIIAATGVPNLIQSDMVASGAIIVDAGTAVEDGKVVGDVSEDVRKRNDITITPTKGGVGPLTICALFDNLLSTYQK